MIRIDLGGSWQFRRTRNWGAWLDAAVPGCVHGDLLANGLIDDPFAGTNELDVLWIDRADWLYRRRFDVPDRALAQAAQQLVFEGLDTVAEVSLNGRRLGRADNMFRRWTFDASGRLRPRGNELLVRFTGAVAEGQRLERRRGRLPGGEYACWADGRTRRTGRNYLRKAQYQFGWDWGPLLATCGIWRPVALVASSGPRIEHVTHRQHHGREAVTVAVTVHVSSPAPSDGTMTVRIGGQTASAPFRVRRGEATVSAEVRISDPKLWFPAGAGEQPLYGLTVELTDRAGRTFDMARRRIGLRTVELVRRPDRIGESFFFRVNGRTVYCKGANWIPADPLPTRLRRGDYQHLLGQAAWANMNMLRVWGGGLYEHDDFYDLCDELGLMVWHDHMFACAAYPADRTFLDNVAAEIRHQVRRLGSHPCIVLWCGNNENEWGMSQWWDKAPNVAALRRDYLKLTRREEAVTRAEAPDTPWWPSSPSTRGDLADVNSTDVGDCHFWEVWHGRKPFTRYLEINPRFQSEFGFQAFPDIETLRPVLGPDDWNLTSPAMEHHQRSRIGNAVICETLCRQFRLPAGLDDFFYVSQLLQATAIQMGVEHWRRMKPTCMGALYWQLNDCWPVASWSSIDSAGRCKALHYAARRFFAPLLLSGIEADGQVELWATSDLAGPLAGRYEAELWSFAGRRLKRLGGRFALRAEESRRIARWPVDRFAPDFDARSQVFLRLTCRAGRQQAENFLFFAPFKQAELPRPRIRVDVRPRGDALAVKLASDAIALFVQCRAGKIAGEWSDNYVHLLPGRPMTLLFRPALSTGSGRPERKSKAARPTSPAALRRALTVRSLRDTY